MIDMILANVPSLPHDVTIHEPLWKYIFNGVCGISTIIIAVVNIIYICKFHHKQDESDRLAKEKDRKMMLLKTLILDHNLKHLYNAFDTLTSHLQVLKIDDKEAVRKEKEKDIQSDLKEFSESFVFLLSAVNTELYESILRDSDNLRDTLVTNLADDGVRLTVDPKYKEFIYNPIMETKKTILSKLFDYKGE